MMPIFESVRAIPSTDRVQKFEHDLLSDSQVIVHTNIKKTKKSQLELVRIKPPENGGIMYFDRIMCLLTQQLIWLGPRKDKLDMHTQVINQY